MSTTQIPVIEGLSPEMAEQFFRALTIEALQAEKYSRKLREYVKAAWHVVEPSQQMVPNWHIDALCDHLEAVTTGQIPKLLVNIPPGCSKSLITCTFWPTWEWAKDPAIRWFFASYDQRLSTRDSMKCRAVFSSDWFKARWPNLKIRKDQDEKTYYETTQGGYRLATSTGGHGTGEHPDRIVCLPAEALVTTDHGDLPIGRIVNGRLDVRVLGPEGWQRIVRYDKNPGKPLVELRGLDWDLVCTEDHPIWVEGRGYLPAGQLEALNGPVLVRRLRQDIRQAAGTCGTSEGRSLLLKGVRDALHARGEAPELGRRERYQALPGLRPGLSVPSLGSPSAHSLLESLPGCAVSATREALSHMRRLVQASRVASALLLKALRQYVSPCTYPWGSEWALPLGTMADSVFSRVPEVSSASDQGPGPLALRRLLLGRVSTGSPHRRLEDEPRAHEPSDALRVLSPSGPHKARHSGRVDEAERLVSVRRRPAPAWVYNLGTDPGHCYYANGVLTHNCDDPHNTKEAPSEAEREATITWWDHTMSLRGVARGARRVVIMQRLHEHDLSGHILSKEDGEGWTHLCVPMRYEPRRMVTTPLGWNDPRKVVDELLTPDQFSEPVVRQMELDLGTFGAAGQLQQRPTPASGGAIKRTWWRYYDSTAPPADLDQCIQSWDTTMKGLEKSDYTVGGVLGRRGALLYVLDIVRGRMNTPETIAAVRGLSTNWPQSKQKLIEDKANGPAVISTLYNEIPGIIAMPVKGDKEQRVSAVTPFIEAGNVLLPGRKIHDDPTEPDRFRWEPAYRWVTELIEECAAFPVGSHDDQVDMLSQGLLYLSQGVYVTRHRAQEEAKRFGPPAKDMIEQHTREVHASLRAKVNKLMSGRNGHRRRGGIGL